MKTKPYLITEDQKVSLKDYPTTHREELDKTQAEKKEIPDNIQQMKDLQEKLYAENKRSLLLVFQAMDAAGKDGVIKHVMTGFNPQGVHVASFKVPSAEESDHDYLWRINKELPRRGEIGIFNRSHYEDVIVWRVHNLVETSQLPEEVQFKDLWERRYRQIRDYEKYLFENGTVILKFFLHVSREEQRQRLLERINRPEKNWKFSSSDIKERKYWDQYMQAYELMLEKTSTKEAPWYVLPADQKWLTRYLVSEIVLNKLKEMNPQFPVLPADELAKLDECRAILEAEAPILKP